jgi:hypothetical protein
MDKFLIGSAAKNQWDEIDVHPFKLMAATIKGLSGKPTDFDKLKISLARAIGMIPKESEVHKRCKEFLDAAALVCLALELERFTE